MRVIFFVIGKTGIKFKLKKSGCEWLQPVSILIAAPQQIKKHVI
jgi:hypothetical protein